MTSLYQIDIGYACFDIEETNGIITFAAPIAGWMIGKKLSFVLSWLEKKKAKIQQVTITSPSPDNKPT